MTGWTVSYRLADDANLTELASGIDATVEATIDPTLLPNGTYFIVIAAESSGGGIGVFESSVVVDGRLKLGRYVTTFTDMAVGVGGFPVEVNRTYDTFRQDGRRFRGGVDVGRRRLPGGDQRAIWVTRGGCKRAAVAA